MHMEHFVNNLAKWYISKGFDKQNIYLMVYNGSPSVNDVREKMMLDKNCKCNIYNISTQTSHNGVHINYSDVDRCNVVLKQMLIDRGTHDNESTIPLFTADVESRYSVLLKNNHDSKHTLILYDLTDKFRWTVLSSWLEDNEDYTGHSISLVIFVIQASLSSSYKKIKLSDDKIDTQIFELADLQMNISRHFLQPKMELIKDPEVITEIIRSYGASHNQFPIMQRDDKMAKYFNAKPGNMMKIYRVSPTSGINVFYRIIF
jgi:DNA-directed RNA polymerase subunit H (RpoH/RPB5)